MADPERVQTPHFHVQRERIHGVYDAMTSAGLDPDSLTVVESYEHLPTSGGAAAEVALEVNPRITALMCTADVWHCRRWIIFGHTGFTCLVR